MLVVTSGGPLELSIICQIIEEMSQIVTRTTSITSGKGPRFRPTNEALLTQLTTPSTSKPRVLTPTPPQPKEISFKDESPNCLNKIHIWDMKHNVHTFQSDTTWLVCNDQPCPN